MGRPLQYVTNEEVLDRIHSINTNFKNTSKKKKKQPNKLIAIGNNPVAINRESTIGFPYNRKYQIK